MTNVRAMLVGSVDGVWKRRIETLTSDSLGEGDVLIEVEYCLLYTSPSPRD